jgi:hypothetical protein
MYANLSSELRDFHENEEGGAVTLNESIVGLGSVHLKESGIDDVESDFNWQIVAKMSRDVVKGRIPPDKRTSENSTQLGKGADKLGEYAGSEILPAVAVTPCSLALPIFRRNIPLPVSEPKNKWTSNRQEMRNVQSRFNFLLTCVIP